MTEIRKRPAVSDRATSITLTTDTHHSADTAEHTVRCRRCRRPIWSQRSVSRCAGPVCFRRELAMAA